MTVTPRLDREALEQALLSPGATFSKDGDATRERAEPPCPVRTSFQRDCHRIVHSKAWRRLRGKTQVFFWPKGDHYRTRLTHCQEVSQIARTLARGLRLNEDLAEAIALGHDLGHSPFGHAGEATLERLVPGGFRHEVQSLRVVEHLENDGRGLNLTAQVRDGIERHSKGTGPIVGLPAARLPVTPEGQLVRLADLIAYVNHDVDDALRAGVLAADDILRLPGGGPSVSRSERLTTLVLDVLEHTDLERDPVVRMSAEAAAGLEEMRAFLHANVYYNPEVHAEFHKAADLLERLWRFFLSDLDRFYDLWPGALRDGAPEDDVRDFLAGMTDAFAVDLHDRLFTPRRWTVY